MKKPELLSPAGNMEALHAAIQGGCDAVYLSGKLYGARSFATNFSEEELEEAVKICHLYGVKVYVTINTLIYETEVKNFLKYVEFLQSISVDAVIIQDIGMMDLLRQSYPSLEIHASTQMHIHNLEGVQLLESLGIKRAVLARETPIELVTEIKRKTNVEIEIFVHGALCVCYSGECLMSSLIGGRSGNRGTCAQCCRQPYDLYSDGKKQNEDQYLLSTKDLNTLKYLPQLIASGADSFKIEGRMKRPEYVYLITSLYRKAIDSYFDTGSVSISKEEFEGMKKIFNRGFTKGFLFHEDNDSFTNEFRPNHMGIPIGVVLGRKNTMIEIKLNEDLHVQDGIRIVGAISDSGKIVDTIYWNKQKVTSATRGNTVFIPYQEEAEPGSLVIKTTDVLQLEALSEEIHSDMRKVSLTGTVVAKVGFPLKLTLKDNQNEITMESDFIVESGKNSPLTKENLKEQIGRLGGTIFSLSHLQCEMDENIFIPIQKINALRRSVIEALSSKRLYHKEIIKGVYRREVPDFPMEKKRTIYVETIEQYEKIMGQNYDEIYIDKTLQNVKDSRFILKIPRVQENLKDQSMPLLVGELGSIYRYHDVVSDFSLNVVNSYSVAFLHSLGVRRVTLSYELNDAQITNLISAYRLRYHTSPNLEMIVSGKIEAMVSKYNLLKKYHLAKDAYLLDKYKNRFPVQEKDGLLYIYHYQNKEVVNREKYYQMGIHSLRDSF